jgi:hypothetical protein
MDRPRPFMVGARFLKFLDATLRGKKYSFIPCGKFEPHSAWLCYQILLTFYSPGKHALASHWLVEFANFMLPYLIIGQSYAA